MSDIPLPQFRGDEYDPVAIRELVSILEQILDGRSKDLRTFQLGTSATVNFLQTSDILLVSYTATGAVTVNLPPAAAMVGRTIRIKDSGLNATTFNITIDANGSETIDGATTALIDTDAGALSLYSDGASWHIMSL